MKNNYRKLFSLRVFVLLVLGCVFVVITERALIINLCAINKNLISFSFEALIKTEQGALRGWQ